MTIATAPATSVASSESTPPSTTSHGSRTSPYSHSSTAARSRPGSPPRCGGATSWRSATRASLRRCSTSTCSARWSATWRPGNGIISSSSISMKSKGERQPLPICSNTTPCMVVGRVKSKHTTITWKLTAIELTSRTGRTPATYPWDERGSKSYWSAPENFSHRTGERDRATRSSGDRLACGAHRQLLAAAAASCQKQAADQGGSATPEIFGLRATYSKPTPYLSRCDCQRVGRTSQTEPHPRN